MTFATSKHTTIPTIKHTLQMKTKRSTKAMFAIAGSLLAIGSIQAQQTMAQRDSLLALQRNAISLITPGEGKAAGKSGFWGYAFGDYAYMAKGDSAGRGTKQQYKGLGEPTVNGTNTQPSSPNSFEIRRAYLGYDYYINSHFSAYALMAYEGDQDVSDNRTVYLKYMYFKWKNIWKNTDLKIGQQATNSFASAYNTEPLMGYRASEKTILDMHGIDGSSDMGVALEGRIWTAHCSDTSKVPLFIGYSIMVGDNSGNNPVAGFTGNATSLSGASLSTPTSTSVSTSTSTTSPITYVSPFTGKDTTVTPTTTTKTTTTTTTTASTQSLNPFNYTTDKAKKYRAQLYVNCLNNALTVGAYMDYINYGDVNMGVNPTGTKKIDGTNFSSTVFQKAVQTTKVYAAYNSKWFGIGGEYFMQTMTNGEIESYASTTYTDPVTKTKTVTPLGTNDTTTAEQMGYSIFAHGTILPGILNIYARYDSYTPDAKYSYSPVGALPANTTASSTIMESFTNNMSNVSNSANGNYYKESFMNVGLDWTPTKDKKIHLMPNVWYYGIKGAYGADQLASSNYMLYRVTFLFAFN